MENTIIYKPYGDRMEWDSLEGKKNRPLELIDSGCQVHEPSKVKITGSEACLLITDIISNLPKDGKFPMYICKHGHTHRLRVKGLKGCQGDSGERPPRLRNLGKRAGA